MRYLSVCSGIGSETVAWHGLGWECAAFAEIDPQASAVLAHHWPDTPNHGDFTTIRGDEYGPVDLLVGGTPCQPFSVAGLRKGMDDDRGNLAVAFLRLVDRVRPRWVVWENVPGIYSTATHDAPDPRPPTVDLDCHDGPEIGEEISGTDEYDADENHAFACFVAGFQELRYSVAYRTLDAQYVRVESHPYAVPQRRKRVFLVGHSRDWRPPVGVLFEPESLRGDPAPCRKSGQAASSLTTSGVGGSGGPDDNAAQAGHLIASDVAGALPAREKGGGGIGTDLDVGGGLVAEKRAEAFGGNNTTGPIEVHTALNAHAGRLDFETETLIAFDARQSDVLVYGDAAGPLDTGIPPISVVDARGARAAADPKTIAFSCKDYGADVSEEISPTLRAMPHDKSHANAGGQVAVAAVSLRGRDGGSTAELHEGAMPAIRASQGGGDKPHILTDTVVRRITPTEAERLMGYADGHTAVPWKGKPMADGPRYRMLGNSICINVLFWIGQRIALFEEIADGAAVGDKGD